MDSKDFKFIEDLLQDHSKAIVGRLCSQNELVKKANLTCDQKLDILKAFNRELIYEEFRNLRNCLKSYSRGLEYKKFKIYKPTDQKV